MGDTMISRHQRIKRGWYCLLVLFVDAVCWCSRRSPLHAFLVFAIRPLQDDERIAVYIRGAQCINRGVDGDIVAFELLPEDEWYSQDGETDVPTEKKVNTAYGLISAMYFFYQCGVWFGQCGLWFDQCGV